MTVQSPSAWTLKTKNNYGQKTINELRELCSPDLLHSGPRYEYGHPRLDRPRYHDPFEHLDHHPLEGERQDLELHLRRLLSARRTITFRTLVLRL